MNYTKGLEILDFIKKNFNDEQFIDWLYEQLGLHLTEAEK